MKLKIGNFQWAARAEHKRLAALMLVALVALAAGVLLMVRIVRLPAPPPRARQAKAGAAGTLNLEPPRAGRTDGQILDEKALFLDPAPLFLPTRHNASQLDNAAGARHEPGESLQLTEPRYVFTDTAFAVVFPEAYPGPAQPVDVLDCGNTQTPYAQFGRVDRAEKPLPARMAQMEIVQMKTGRTLLTLPLAPPPTTPTPASTTASTTPALPDALAGVDWRPLEFLVALDIAGMVGSPALVQGSGSPAVDDFFATHLVRTLHLGARRDLGAGFYLVRIGP